MADGEAVADLASQPLGDWDIVDRMFTTRRRVWIQGLLRDCRRWKNHIQIGNKREFAETPPINHIQIVAKT
jgi:hypothetical protein